MRASDALAAGAASGVCAMATLDTPASSSFFRVAGSGQEGDRPDVVPTLGVFRLVERIGAAVGPLIAVVLAITLSYRESIIAIGLLCSVTALVFLIAFPKAALPPLLARPVETAP